MEQTGDEEPCPKCGSVWLWLLVDGDPPRLVNVEPPWSTRLSANDKRFLRSIRVGVG